MKFLVDECLHTSLIAVAHRAGHEAHHVVYPGMSGRTDAEIVAHAIKSDFILVTNNALDFLRFYRREKLHPGLIMFSAILKLMKHDEPINEVLEATLSKGKPIVKRCKFHS